MERVSTREGSAAGAHSSPQTMDKCLKPTRKSGLWASFMQHGKNALQGRHMRLFPQIALVMLIAYSIRARDSFYRLSSTPAALQPQKGKYKQMHKGVNISQVVAVPSHFNRFNSPWYVPLRVQLRSLVESRNRILYSPLRQSASDGIGHAFGIMNAEVGAALRLGLSYSHRIASYGSISNIDKNAVEDFFGWGFGEIERSAYRETFCASSFNGLYAACQTCDRTVTNKSFPHIQPRRVVQIPANLTYSRRLCGETDLDELKLRCVLDVREFVRRNNEPNTIFQMPLETCAQSPVDRYPDPATKAFFFHKYWDLHGRGNAMPHPKAALSNAQGNSEGRVSFDRFRIPHPSHPIRRVVAFWEDHLIIAVHARRGDFFEVKRDMVSCKAFGVSIRETMRIVQNQGGVFSHLPVAIYMYSEGRAKPGIAHMGHDIRKMTRDFVDSDGKVRDAKWVEAMIRGSGEDSFEFKNGLEVHLRIATDTLQSMHEMVAADVFFGSHSALGRYVVGTLFRGGLHLLPQKAIIKPFDWRCCTIPFSSKSGTLHGPQHAVEYWKAYVRANENSVMKVWRSRRRRRSSPRE